MKRQWCLTGGADASYVAHMEDVLAVYTRPFDERFPQLCMDEGCKQLVRSKREALPMRPGQAACEDYEYEPQGWCNVFVVCEPLGGRRFLQVYERRTKEEWASFMREVIDEQYPQAEKIILVMDNLNTHTTASFYEVFTPEEAFRLSQKLEIHYTPRHGSWLNMAEIELSVLARQALAERLATMAQVQARVAAWQQRRNQQQAGISWRFTSQDARIKLARLYPSLEA